MAFLARLHDFTPATLIQSAQVDNEFNQLINALSGLSSANDFLLKYSHASDPVLTLDQVAGGLIQTWKQNNVEKARVNNNGGIQTTNQLISTIVTGTAPINVASTTVCPNLNADLLDGLNASNFVRNDIAGQLVTSDFNISGTAPSLTLTDTTVSEEDLTLALNANVATLGFVGGPTILTLTGGVSDNATFNRPLILSDTLTANGIATFQQDVVVADDSLQINAAGNPGVNNRLFINHSSSPDANAVVSFRAGATTLRPLDLVAELTPTTDFFRAIIAGDTVARLNLTQTGVLESRLVLTNGAGTSDIIRHGGVMKTFITQVGNVSTNETDLHTFTTPANTFSVNGDAMEFESAVFLNANGNTKTVRVYFAGTAFMTRATTAGDRRFVIRGHIIRVSSTQVRTCATMIFGIGATETAGQCEIVSQLDLVNASGGAFTNSQIWKITGQSGTATDDVIITSTILKFWPSRT